MGIAPLGINRKRWKKVSPEEVERWVALSNQGYTTREIGRKCDREHTLVRKWLLKVGVSQEQITQNAQKANQEKRGPLACARKDKGIYRKHTALSKHCYNMLCSAASRAAKQEMPFTLDLEFLIELYHNQAGQCALTGLSMNLDSPKIGRSRPFVPSLDRIDSTKGYTKDNVRLVCWAVNVALSQWGESQFNTICRAYIRRRDGN